MVVPLGPTTKVVVPLGPTTKVVLPLGPTTKVVFSWSTLPDGGAMTGRETACADGLMVVEPATMTGAETLFAGTAVPVRVAVTVEDDMTSVKVTTLAGEGVEGWEEGLVVCSAH